jgi:hypothetical protein
MSEPIDQVVNEDPNNTMTELRKINAKSNTPGVKNMSIHFLFLDIIVSF